ncbi:uncharacterized mitochondrial protein AtMg00310-like [Fagus crenata]
MAVRKIVEMGYCWKVGNGRQISIWEDKWIPSPSTYKISSLRLQNEGSFYVNDLIDPQTKSWKDLISQSFRLEDAALILKIPLPNEGTSDSIFWVGNSSGVFSISSAYKLLESSYEVDLEESSSGKVDGSLWKAI